MKDQNRKTNKKMRAKNFVIVEVDPEQKERFDKVVKKEKTNRSRVLRRLINSYIKEKGGSE